MFRVLHVSHHDVQTAADCDHSYELAGQEHNGNVEGDDAEVECHWTVVVRQHVNPQTDLVVMVRMGRNVPEPA